VEKRVEQDADYIKIMVEEGTVFGMSCTWGLVNGAVPASELAAHLIHQFILQKLLELFHVHFEVQLLMKLREEKILHWDNM